MHPMKNFEKDEILPILEYKSKLLNVELFLIVRNVGTVNYYRLFFFINV